MGAIPLGFSDAAGDGDGVPSSSSQCRERGCVLQPYDVVGVVLELLAAGGLPGDWMLGL